MYVSMTPIHESKMITFLFFFPSLTFIFDRMIGIVFFIFFGNQ